MTSAITPRSPAHPCPRPSTCSPAPTVVIRATRLAVVTHGEFTGRVWRHIHHDSEGTRFEFDATIDGLVDASSSGVGDNPTTAS